MSAIKTKVENIRCSFEYHSHVQSLPSMEIFFQAYVSHICLTKNVNRDIATIHAANDVNAAYYMFEKVRVIYTKDFGKILGIMDISDFFNDIWMVE